MSFKEFIQALAMLVPTLLVVLAAAFSVVHSDDRPSVKGDSVAAAARAQTRQARSGIGEDDEQDEAQ